MKKFVPFLSFILIIVFSFSCFADSYSAYSSVTENTSQISILIQSMFNQSDFDPFKDWVALRTNDYTYCLFYNINRSSGNAVRLRYYATSSGYNTIWHFDRAEERGLNYSSGNYTIVGNTEDTLGSSSYRSFLHQFIFKFSVPFILVLFIIFIFRIRKRGVLQL